MTTSTALLLALLTFVIHTASAGKTGVGADADLAKDPNTSAFRPGSMVMYRLIGNDMPPLQCDGQLGVNIAYTLEHEGSWPSVQKRWILNRIIYQGQHNTIVRALKEHGFEDSDIIDIPFEYDVYSKMSTETDRLMYMAPQNEARNAGIDAGFRDGFEWVFMLDGNTFFTNDMWAFTANAARRAGSMGKEMLKIPYHRLTSMQNTELLHAASPWDAVVRELAPFKGESQLAFRNPTRTRFPVNIDTWPEMEDRGRRTRGYGTRNKSFLFKYGNACDPRSAATCECADIDEVRESQGSHARKKKPSAHKYVPRCGMVLRLWSYPVDQHSALQDILSDGNRKLKRDEAIQLKRNLLSHRPLPLREGGNGATLYDMLLQSCPYTRLSAPFHNTIAIVPETTRRVTMPVFYRHEALAQSQEHHGQVNMRDDTFLFAEAEAALYAPVITILDKRKTAPSGDRRDYYSVNPRRRPIEGCGFDHTNWAHVVIRITSLTLAGERLGNHDYTAAAVTQVVSWFLDPKTSMAPNWTYAQYNMRGRSSHGIIEGKDMVALVDCFRLLEPHMTGEQVTGLRKWTEKLALWLLHDELSQDERLSTDYRSAFYYLQLVSLLSYSGFDPILMDQVYDEVKHHLHVAYMPNGQSPKEMVQPSSLHYTYFSLAAWIQLADVFQAMGYDLYGEHFLTKKEILPLYQKGPRFWGKSYPSNKDLGGSAILHCEAPVNAWKSNQNYMCFVDDDKTAPIFKSALAFAAYFFPGPDIRGVAVEADNPCMGRIGSAYSDNYDIMAKRLLPFMFKWEELYGKQEGNAFNPFNQDTIVLPSSPAMPSILTMQSGMILYWWFAYEGLNWEGGKAKADPTSAEANTGAKAGKQALKRENTALTEAKVEYEVATEVSEMQILQHTHLCLNFVAAVIYLLFFIFRCRRNVADALSTKLKNRLSVGRSAQKETSSVLERKYRAANGRSEDNLRRRVSHII